MKPLIILAASLILAACGGGTVDGFTAAARGTSGLTTVCDVVCMPGGGTTGSTGTTTTTGTTGTR